MGKSKAHGRPPRSPASRRERDGSTFDLTDEVLTRATEEITAKLDQITLSRGPAGAATPSAGSSRLADPSEITLRDARITDFNLISRVKGGASAEVIALHAHPRLQAPGCVEIRIDGWEGHLVLALPRDRAALLARKLEQAVEMLREGEARGTSGARAQLVIDSSSHAEPRSQGRRRKPLARGHREATDRVLSDLSPGLAVDEEDVPE